MTAAEDLVPGLKIPLLRVLFQARVPLSASQICVRMQKGSTAGARRALDRLAHHGLVDAEDIAGLRVYSLNREHILFDAVRKLIKAEDRARH